MQGYKPYKDELYKQRMLLKIQQNRSFINAFKYDWSQQFYKIVKNTVNPKFQFTQNLVLSLNGSTGSGKSAIMLSLGKKFFPHFSWRNIMFFDQHILDRAKDFKKNTLIIRDENPAKGIFGQGSVRTQGQLVVLGEVSRKYGLNLAFIEPEFAENAITKYYLETMDMSFEQRLTRCALMDAATKQYMGHILVPIVPESDRDWVKYNENKDEFIDKVRKGDFSGSKLDYGALADKAINDPDFGDYRNKKERKAYLIMKYPNYTAGEIDTIQSIIEVKLRS